MRYKATVFDLDGTLINSLEDIVNAFNFVLQEMGYPVLEKNRIKEKTGLPIKERVIDALPEGDNNEKRIAEFHKKYRRELRSHCLDNTRPYDGVFQMLKALKKQGFKTGIFTNKNEKTANMVIRELLSEHNFDVIRGKRSGVPEKPNPTAAYLIADELGIAVEQIIYVGDTIVDIETAKASGMLPVGVAWGFNSPQMLENHGAQVILEHPNDLINLELLKE